MIQNSRWYVMKKAPIDTFTPKGSYALGTENLGIRIWQEELDLFESKNLHESFEWEHFQKECAGRSGGE